MPTDIPKDGPDYGRDFLEKYLHAELTLHYSLSKIIRDYSFPVTMALPGSALFSVPKLYLDGRTLAAYDLPLVISHIQDRIVKPIVEEKRQTYFDCALQDLEDLNEENALGIAEASKICSAYYEYMRWKYKVALKLEKLPDPKSEKTFSNIIMRGGTVSFVEDLQHKIKKKFEKGLSEREWWEFFNPPKDAGKNFTFYRGKVCQQTLQVSPIDPPPGLIVYADYVVRSIVDDIYDTFMCLAFKGHVEKTLKARKEWRAAIERFSGKDEQPSRRGKSKPHRSPLARFSQTYKLQN